ncbi:MAG: hypothetical protein CMP07_12945 [Xanthomonadales bacterium]|nr:hypothetical protein [Xanthomonadales bacterium]
MRWLRLQFLRGSRQHRGRVRAWLREHPRISGLLERGGCLNVDEYALARGIAVGLLVGFTPTVGIQTLMMLAGSLSFRANFIAAFIVSNVSNPFTMAPLYYSFNRLGSWLLQRLPVSHAPIEGLGEEIARETLAMFIGSLAIAIPASAVGYFLFLWLWRKLGLHMPVRKSAPNEPEQDGTEPPDPPH